MNNQVIKVGTQGKNPAKFFFTVLKMKFYHYQLRGGSIIVFFHTRFLRLAGDAREGPASRLQALLSSPVNASVCQDGSLFFGLWTFKLWLF